ncbi:MAG TPA: malate synthase A [Nitrososphaerales archaeon]|nr:malate synthase A [Nitrososphaerales archaeon]
MSKLESVERAEISAPYLEGSSKVLTPEALEIVATLDRQFSSHVSELMKERAERQKLIDSGVLPDFPEDNWVRTSEWSVSKIPKDLLDRRVEITGPAGDRKMVINALNSGASTYMADFEDSLSPTWEQIILGQLNLMDVVDKTIRLVTPEGKVYALGEETATLIVRPRGLHLLEKHFLVQGKPVTAPLFDFGVFLHHNAGKLRKQGSGPYFYLPKLEGAKEARLWEHVLSSAEDYLGLSRGTIKVTVLIETLPAAFEMDEILYELRRHIVGLNCGRWDYMFSFIKKLKNHPHFVLPERSQLTMDKGFLAPYVDLLIKTCHRRGAYAIGGMSAYIPVKDNQAANNAALAKVSADKKREFALGHDGTWVAHPGLVGIAMDAFSRMDGPNQLRVRRFEVTVTRDDLLLVPRGTITMEGVVLNVNVGLRYLESWLSGRGSVPINNLMEDAATTEICRAQLWQWVRNRVTLADGRTVTAKMVRDLITDQVALMSNARGQAEAEKVQLAGKLFAQMATAEEFPEFITIPAYDELLAIEGRRP